MTHHPECEDATGEYPGSCTCAIDAVKALQARVKVLEEALTPSAATKAAYMPEFSLTNAAVALSGKSHSPANCCALDRNQDNHGDDPRPSSTTGDRTMTDSTQADRDAAKEYDPLLWEIKPSCPEFQNLIQAFARHRLAERAKIVAWLREQAGPKEMLLFNETAWVLADCIEADEHKTFTHPDNV